MATEHSLMSLFVNASLLVKAVMLLLLAASVMSWTLIFQRWKLFKLAKQSVEDFEETFWSGVELNKLYHKFMAANRDEEERSGCENLFISGFKEFIRLRRQSSVQPGVVVEGTQRAMRIALSREVERLEKHLSFLATVGSVSPYVGLFGTVWGIMNSLQSLGAVQQASLSMVAPGISEALVATAIGLFAAIPAVVAYNRYTNRLQWLVGRYETFSEEFTNILSRQAYSSLPREAAREPVEVESLESEQES